MLLGVVAGCSSLPTIVPDLARSNGPAVLLEGARGPLSMAQSKAILDGLAIRSPNTDIFDRHLALEEGIADSPLTTGNQVLLLQDGPATYQAMLAAIVAAEDHINMEVYILDDDEVGQRFAQALMAKQAQGVQVNLLRDSIGTFGTPAAFFEQLVASGIQVHEFNPVNPLAARDAWQLNQRNHRKLLIVDGHTAFMGGINISSVYSGGSFRSGSRGAPKNAGDDGTAWRDTDLKLQGPVVADFQKIFLDDWAKQKGPPLAPRNYFPPAQTAGKLVVRAIGSSPEEPFSQIYATLLSAIGSAETSVRITNAYFVPDPQLLDTLEAAAQRGVDVTLILPSQTDSWLVFHAGRRHYDRLLLAGVRIYERRGVILHSKVALIDGVWATVGSTNLDWRSFLHNHELNAVVLGADFGHQVQALFDKDLAASDDIALEQWRRRGLGVRVKELFARVWEYWL
ncbi:cardiolipin synthase [Hydrogenophaga sp. PAMC20947]|uniref:cardiolipin synthase n=1 Tax=Hydrogenophaga sp. PAMC20947 TaxID=2565558 RepID=UPI001FF88285|nr:cardiolipin synthase [Hydrogenophaga sp. PAMC20947]